MHGSRHRTTLCGVLTALLLLAAPVRAEENSDTGRLIISNELGQDVLLGIDRGRNAMRASFQAGEDLPYRIPAGGELSLQLPSAYYALLWQEQNRPMSVLLTRGETTQLALRSGGVRQQDVLGVVRRNGQEQQKELLASDGSSRLREPVSEPRREAIEPQRRAARPGTLRLENHDSRRYAVGVDTERQTLTLYDRREDDLRNDLDSGTALSWTVPAGTYEVEWLGENRRLSARVEPGRITELRLDRDEYSDVTLEVREDGVYKGTSTLATLGRSTQPTRTVIGPRVYSTPVVVRRTTSRYSPTRTVIIRDSHIYRPPTVIVHKSRSHGHRCVSSCRSGCKRYRTPTRVYSRHPKTVIYSQPKPVIRSSSGLRVWFGSGSILDGRYYKGHSRSSHRVCD